MITVADLFAGIGGFHIGFDNVGAKVVFASENCPFARQTYETNFHTSNPEMFEGERFMGDITQVDSSNIPDFDVLTAGFPCQPFSLVGRRLGFQDTRGTMFHHIVRIMEQKLPEAFVLENVQGLLSHDNGRTFDIIKHIITEGLGYSFHYSILRACDYGLPQLRPRLFMVGFKDPTTPYAFPSPIPLRFTLSDLLDGEVNRDISRTVRSSGRQSKLGDRHNWDTVLLDGKEYSFTVQDVKAIQGFPIHFTFPVSDSQAYKQLGNAVAPPVAEAVARSIVNSLTYM